MRHFGPRSGVESMLGQSLASTLRQHVDAYSEEIRDASGRLKHKGNCYICKKRRSTRKSCGKCEKPVCASHSSNRIYCNQCK